MIMIQKERLLNSSKILVDGSAFVTVFHMERRRNTSGSIGWKVSLLSFYENVNLLGFTRAASFPLLFRVCKKQRKQQQQQQQLLCWSFSFHFILYIFFFNTSSSSSRRLFLGRRLSPCPNQMAGLRNNNSSSRPSLLSDLSFHFFPPLLVQSCESSNLATVLPTRRESYVVHRHTQSPFHATSKSCVIGFFFLLSIVFFFFFWKHEKVYSEIECLFILLPVQVIFSLSIVDYEMWGVSFWVFCWNMYIVIIY